MDLDVHKGPVGLGELRGVAGIAIHVTVGVGSAAVREQVHHLVNCLLVRAQVVPEHGGVLQVSTGVALLGVDEEGEVARIPQEEDGRVVEHPVPVTLLRVELERKAYTVCQPTAIHM